jgi:rRNA processing protein Krr1/Pno1
MSDDGSKSPSSPERDNERAESRYTTADLSVEPEEPTDSKRKRSEDSTDAADANEYKKNRSEDYPAQSPQAAPLPVESGAAGSYTDGGMKTEVAEIAQDKVGQVIGSKGAIIQDLQAKTGCKILVNQDFPPGAPRQIVYSGTPAQIKMAKDLVNLIVDRGPTALHMLNGPVVTQTIECPQPLVGRVIGSGGSTIRDIQARCGVKIQVHQDMPDGVPRKIEVVGNPSSVAMAVSQIKQVMEAPPGSGPGSHTHPHGHMGAPMGMPPVAVMPHMGMGAPMGGHHAGGPPQAHGQHVMECAKQYVGRIIGRAGETINLLQQKSGAKVQIDQKVGDTINAFSRRIF